MELGKKSANTNLKSRSKVNEGQDDAEYISTREVKPVNRLKNGCLTG